MTGPNPDSTAQEVASRPGTEQTSCSTGVCPLSGVLGYIRRKPTVLFWALIIGLLLAAQWPQLKAAYYSMTGAQAPADNIPWRTDYDAALAEARQTGKLALLDFTASWCPPCQVMKHEVWPDEDVRQAIEAKYIPVYLDTDHPATAPAAARYGVQMIPSLFIVDGEGNIIKSGGFMSRREMLDFLRAG